jgi:hypothetical protein
MNKTIIPLSGIAVVTPQGLAVDKGKTHFHVQGIWYDADPIEVALHKLLHAGYNGHINEDAAEEICLGVEWTG